MSTRRVGKYEILDEIGRGGFGTVYRARDTMLDRVVALKVLHPQLLVDPTFLTRFQQEARTAARLNHPYIVTIHELGETEGVWHIAMAFLPGRPLDRIMREEGPLEPERALTVARDIGAALDHAHSLDLVHRDVKPSNIIVGDDGHATLTDFGLVRAALQSTLSTTMGLIGTPTYMSPEQCEGEELDGRSDLYALAVVLYEMLTGRAPFQADTPLAVMRGHADKPPPPPRALNPRLSEPLEAVLLRSLAKDRAARYASGAGLAEALEQALQARDARKPTAHAAVTQAPAKAEKAPGKRMPGWVLLLGGVLAVAIVAVALVLLSGGDTGAETRTPEPTQVVAAAPTSTTAPTRTSTPSSTFTPTPTRTSTPTPTNTPRPSPTPLVGGSGRIAFRSSRDGNAEIYVMNADGSGQIRLTDNPASDGSPAWSPDGTRIAFTSERDGNWEIYVMNADGNKQTRLTDNLAEDRYPAWSPDGTRIAFQSERDGNDEIYVMNDDGSDQTRLTDNPAPDIRGAWSPDGKRIAFYSYRDGNWEIYVMNADGSAQTRLTTDPADDVAPAWSP